MCILSLHFANVSPKVLLHTVHIRELDSQNTSVADIAYPRL